MLLLREYRPEKLEARAREAVLHTRINWAYRRWQEYMQSTDTWGDTHAGVLGHRPAAYFSAEFGLHESLPIYSGGLGVLAGDHLKSASDLGIPLVGVGPVLPRGLLLAVHRRERLAAGRRTPIAKTANLPLRAGDRHRRQAGADLPSIRARGPDSRARVAGATSAACRCTCWTRTFRRTRDEDRQLTARLYGGDQRTRIRQEIMLGIGGVRALTALGIQPGVIHMNEGHSAFAALEIIRDADEGRRLSFDDALRETAAMSVFTTHTPVPPVTTASTAA